MATLASVNSLNASIALAERQVQRDQAQVQQDSARLDQSQAQLVHDQRQLSSVQEQGRSAEATLVSAPKISRTIAEPAAAAPLKARINAQGQTIGTLINIVA